jgi:hypothetical protein
MCLFKLVDDKKNQKEYYNDDFKFIANFNINLTNYVNIWYTKKIFSHEFVTSN